MEEMICQSCGAKHMTDVSGPLFSEWVVEHAEEIGLKPDGTVPMLKDKEFPMELLEGIHFRPIRIESCKFCSKEL